MKQIFPHLVIWAVLTTVVIFLAVLRRRVRVKSDELLHVTDAEQSMVGTQANVAKRLDAIDRWGKLLTAVVVLYALAIAALYLYSVFSDTSIPQ